MVFISQVSGAWLGSAMQDLTICHSIFNETIVCDYLYIRAGKQLCLVDKLDYAVSMSKHLIITGTRSHKTKVLRGDYTVKVWRRDCGSN